MAKLTVTIAEDKWPKLTMNVVRENEDGTISTSTDKQQYDTAYTAFENVIHNHLRPMVEQVVKSRLKK